MVCAWKGAMNLSAGDEIFVRGAEPPARSAELMVERGWGVVLVYLVTVRVMVWAVEVGLVRIGRSRSLLVLGAVLVAWHQS